jgi:alanyl-tRNA synthetase
MKTSEEIRQGFIDFWSSAPRNAKQIPNVSLVPNNDPTLLFVNSGVFPIVNYLAGEPHPLGKRIFNVQRVVRTVDIDNVGDFSHLTLFEMIGNWSLGDFTKSEQIPWMLEVYVEVFGLDPNRLYASVWGGDERIPRDDVAIEAWKVAFRKYGIEAEFSEDTSDLPATLEDSKGWTKRIFPFGKKSNWWQRAADLPGEIGGPSSELFYDLGKTQYKIDEEPNINDDSGRYIEIGNNVFMEFKFGDDNAWHEMEQKNIDFGGGFERIVVAVQDKLSIYETDTFAPILDRVSALAGKKYDPESLSPEELKSFRIVAEHSRAATFMIADGVIPGNKDQSYILRRLIRRAIRHATKIGIENDFLKEMATSVIEKMKGAYPHLEENREFVLETIDKEEKKFRNTLIKGVKAMRKMIEDKEQLNGQKAFYIYETYGFPLELTLEEFELTDEEKEKITAEYMTEENKHKEASRAGSAQKFTGGLADKSEQTTALHTAHHLLLAALQKVLGSHVHQRGSNITAERLRIDFSHNEGLTEEQKKQVEDIVNQDIQANYTVKRVELTKETAEKLGAEMEFGQKYGDKVNVYMMGNLAEEIVNDQYTDQNIAELIKKSEVISMEFCGGPHVTNTGKLSEYGTFKIQKQESSGSGVRRIKAILAK